MLDEPASRGTLIVLHHPPLGVPGHPMVADVLCDPQRLGAALADRDDVRAVLCGHLHQQLSGLLGTVPVWVTPGVVTRTDATGPAWLVRGVLGAAASLIDLPSGAAAVFRTLHARDPRAGEQVYLVDAVTFDDVAVEGTTGRR